MENKKINPVRNFREVLTPLDIRSVNGSASRLVGIISNGINITLGYPLVFLLEVYQKTLSPDHGLLKFFYPYGYCKFYPSCSMYATEVLKKNGILGMPRIIKRIFSCTPSSLGGLDLP